MISNIAPPSNITPANLLDNSNFERFINQRGIQQSSESWAYCIDRWITAGDTNRKTYTNSDHVSLESERVLIQAITGKSKRVGKAMTLAVCTTEYGVISASDAYRGDGDANQVATIINNVELRIYSAPDDDNLYVWVKNNNTAADNYIHLKWAALYEGAYAADALPAYTPKPYSVELAESRRYYQRYSYAQYETIGMSYEGPAYCFVQIGVLGQMRVKYPTLKISAPISIGTQNRIPNTAIITSGNVILGLNYSAIAASAGATYSYTSNAAGVTIELSADL